MFRKFLAATAATSLLLVGGAATAQSASAETLKRSGSTATIKPTGAPAGARVSKATVTVKKGKKTVAKNKKSYKAKKGTYKVTSTITYKPRTTAKKASATDVWAQCRVSNRVIVNDRTERDDYYWDRTMDFYGQVTVKYTGSCTDTLWVGDNLKKFTWNTTWTDDESIWTDYLPASASAAAISAAKVNELSYKVGDVGYVFGTDMASLPTVGWNYGSTKVAKSTRKVIVR